MSGAWRIRRGVPGDLEALRRVAGVCVEAPRWSESVWRGLLAGYGDVARVVFVADRGGEVVGFLVVGCAAGVAEIESVAVSSAVRRLGMGRALCMEAMHWARGQGAAVMELEVRASSVGAIALYKALGFVEQGWRRGYYRDPVDDAMLMTMELPSDCGAVV